MVGSSHGLYRLDSSHLEQLDRRSLATPSRLLAADVSESSQGEGDDDDDGVVLHCDNAECAVVQLSNLSAPALRSIGASEVLNVEGTENVQVYGIVNGELLYGEREIPITDSEGAQAAKLTKANFDLGGGAGGQDFYSVEAVRKEKDPFTSLVFLSSFSEGNYTYFVVRLHWNGYKTRVIRICNSDEGNLGPGESLRSFVSYYEAELACSVGVDTDEILAYAAAFVESSGEVFGSTLLLSVSVLGEEDSSSYLCAYDLAEINSSMDNKFSDCISSSGTIGISRDSSTEMCISVTPEQIKQNGLAICNLVAQFKKGLEVENPIEPFSAGETVVSSVGDHVSAMTHTVVDGHLLMFLGTSEGLLYEFHILDSTAVNLIHEFELNFPMTSSPFEKNVTQILTAEDGESVFVLTTKRLFKHPVDVCGTMESCDECVMSGDPICGWCTLSRKCSRQKDCPRVEETMAEPVWVTQSNSSDKCPTISGISPQVIYIPEQAQKDVAVLLTTANIPEGLIYSCVFSFAMEPREFVSMAVRTGDMLTCPIPILEDMHGYNTDEDSVYANVSLQYEDIPFITSDTRLAFTNCSIHQSCTSCVGSDKACGWCPFSFQCIPYLVGPEDPETSTCPKGNTHLENNCPAIKPSPLTTDYLVHVNRSDPSPLRIIAVQLESLLMKVKGSHLECVISHAGTNLYRINATYNSVTDMITCMNKFDFPSELGSLEADLKVLWVVNPTQNYAIDNADNAKVVLYSCPGMGQNCAQCLSIESEFGCGFDDGNNAATTVPSGGPINTCVYTEDHESPSRLLSDPVGDITKCALPVIKTFTPVSGPTEGGTDITIRGTNLGAVKDQILSVRIAGLYVCELNEYVPGSIIHCTTTKLRKGLVSGNITVEFNYSTIAISNDEFRFEIPTLDSIPVVPMQGPSSGGSNVTVRGNYLNIGNSRSVTIADQNCTIMGDRISATEIQCVTSSSDIVLNGIIQVQIDDWSIDAAGFNYLKDPTYKGISPNFTFLSGGTDFIVTGENLNTVASPYLIFYVTIGDSVARQEKQEHCVYSKDPCVVEADNPGSMTCTAPLLANELANAPQRFTDAMRIGFGLHMDGVTDLLRINASTVVVFPDPTFGSVELSKGDTLIISGSGFYFTEEQVLVTLHPCQADLCPCDMQVSIDSANGTMMCGFSSQLLQVGATVDVYVTIGNLSKRVDSIELPSPMDLLLILIPVFAGVLILSVVVFIVVIAIFCRKTQTKDKRYEQLMLELEKLESNVAQECKLGFAELQTNLDELTGDVSGHRLPYHEMQNYILLNLFPGAKDHPILHTLELPNDVRGRVTQGLRDFHQLLLDKKVLLIFIRSLEEQRTFSIRDKSIVGSLLLVCLLDRLDYATDILTSLLSDLIKHTAHPKLFLRRTESVAEKLLTNWLSICLQHYILEHAGQPLYLMYRAVKNQLEKGPIDVVTGEARYSLSEQRLIRQKVDVEVISASVTCLESEVCIHVKLLNCDTISQAKEKMLDAIYKATPISQRPPLTSVDLEYEKSTPPMEELVILRDEDGSTVYEGGWKRINTLRHYRIKNRATFRLVNRKERPSPGQSFDYPASLISTHSTRQRSLSEAEDGMRVWHLFKQLDDDHRRSPFLSKRMVSEIYLPRMLSTKTILQKFVDDLFNSLFSISHAPPSPTTPYSAFFPRSPGFQVPMGYAPGAESIPMAIKYIFDFLDKEADKSRIADPEVIHTWKNNALSLRFWVNIIKNPEFVFDINKSHTVDACLSVVAQAFIDSCFCADIKLTIDSPTSKLLYNKEVHQYKSKVTKFYHDIHELPKVSDESMYNYLRQLSTYLNQLMKKTGGFVMESALYELLRYGIKYQDHFLDQLRASGLEQQAQLFEGVLRQTL